MMIIIQLLFILIAGHALADFGLQNDFIAKNKARGSSPIWLYVLISHSLIHGLFVYLATGSVILGLIETSLHALLDFFKCEGAFNIHVDQAAHILCKVLYVVYLIGGFN